MGDDIRLRFVDHWIDSNGEIHKTKPMLDMKKAASRILGITTLDRGPHTIKFVTTFIPGNNNDIVRLYIDGAEKVCGTSWENYYRFGERNPVTPSGRLMWRLSTPVPAGAPSLLGRRNRKRVTREDFGDAMEKILLGAERTSPCRP